MPAHRHWRLNITSSSDASFVAITELELRNTGTDQLDGPTLEHLASSSHPSHNPEWAADNLLNRGWFNNTGDFPVTWAVKRQDNVDIDTDELGIYLATAHAGNINFAPAEFTIEYSDDAVGDLDQVTTWTVAETISATGWALDTWKYFAITQRLELEGQIGQTVAPIVIYPLVATLQGQLGFTVGIFTTRWEAQIGIAVSPVPLLSPHETARIGWVASPLQQLDPVLIQLGQGKTLHRSIFGTFNLPMSAYRATLRYGQPWSFDLTIPAYPTHQADIDAQLGERITVYRGVTFPDGTFYDQELFTGLVIRIEYTDTPESQSATIYGEQQTNTDAVNPEIPIPLNPEPVRTVTLNPKTVKLAAGFSMTTSSSGLRSYVGPINFDVRVGDKVIFHDTTEMVVGEIQYAVNIISETMTLNELDISELYANAGPEPGIEIGFSYLPRLPWGTPA